MTGQLAQYHACEVEYVVLHAPRKVLQPKANGFPKTAILLDTLSMDASWVRVPEEDTEVRALIL
jgi:hypothetical protein